VMVMGRAPVRDNEGIVIRNQNRYTDYQTTFFP